MCNIKKMVHQTIPSAQNVKQDSSLHEKALKMVKRLNLRLVLIIQNVNTLKVKISHSLKGLKCPKCGEGILITRKGEKDGKNGSLKAVLITQNVIIRMGIWQEKQIIFLT